MFDPVVIDVLLMARDALVGPLIVSATM